jgi:hypothetical protein
MPSFGAQSPEARMSSAAQPPAPDRRRFMKTVGLVGASSALIPPLFAFAQAPTPPAGSSATPAPADTSKAAAGPPAPSEDAKALAAIVERRYGKHLTPEQLEQVTRELDGRVQAGRRLKDAKLANGDEPDFTFGA